MPRHRSERSETLRREHQASCGRWKLYSYAFCAVMCPNAVMIAGIAPRTSHPSSAHKCSAGPPTRALKRRTRALLAVFDKQGEPPWAETAS